MLFVNNTSIEKYMVKCEDLMCSNPGLGVRVQSVLT